jgi:hypothetical protein
VQRRAGAALLLTWPKNPSRINHLTLGLRQRWNSKCRRYCVDRYPGGSKQFIAMLKVVLCGHPDVGSFVRWELIGRHKTLAAAQRACQQHFKEIQTQTTEQPAA